MRREITAGPLVLRKLAAALAPLLLEAATTSCSPAFTQFAPWCQPTYALADSEQFIAQSEAEWQQQAAFQVAILDGRTGEYCGGIGLNQPNRAHGLYNLGYWVRPSRQRQGLATAATRALAQAAFADLPSLQRLARLTMPTNVASPRTALAAGATQEGGGCGCGWARFRTTPSCFRWCGPMGWSRRNRPRPIRLLFYFNLAL